MFVELVLIRKLFRVAENHWRSIHAAKAEKAAEERERKRREVKERIKEIEVRFLLEKNHKKT